MLPYKTATKAALRITVSLLFPAAFMLLVIGCGGGTQTTDSPTPETSMVTKAQPTATKTSEVATTPTEVPPSATTTPMPSPSTATPTPVSPTPIPTVYATPIPTATPIQPTPTAIKAPTATPTTSTVTQIATQNTKITQKFGPSGLISDLESWADIQLPDFITASHIDIDDIALVSKFRSSAGHDFSDSFMTCCSMKHYFHPIDYYGSRFNQRIYSLVDGVVLYLSKSSGPGANDWRISYEEVTGDQPPVDYRDWTIFIRPDDAPNIWVTHMHVNPLDEIVKAVPPTDSQDLLRGISRPSTIGYRVKAGQLIAYGLGEIIVKRHLDGSGFPSPCNSGDVRTHYGHLPGCRDKVQLHSIFEFMTDTVFEEYRKVSNVSRSDFIITAEERAANPLACDGESFTEIAYVDDGVNYIRLQDSITILGKSLQSSGESEATANTESSTQELPGVATLSAERDIIISFEASGTHVLSKFDVDQPYLVVIASERGPIEVSIDDGSGKRGIYSRPLSSGISTYETPTLESGQIEISVEADEDVIWRIVVVKVD